MPEYRRLFVPGACYFFTVNLADRRSDRLTREIAALRSAVASTRARHAFVIEAWVVLPDHLHAVWTLPEGDCDFSTRWASIKHLFSWQLPPGEARSRSRSPSESVAFGSAGIGSTRSATRLIFAVMSITCTSTR